MYNLGIVGDLHIDTNISSRKDNYFTTCLDKLTEVASKCSNIIILGDVFNRETLPNDYFYSFYTHLSYLKLQYGTQFYSIIGNHDIPNEDETNLQKTTLGLCSLTGLIKLIQVDKPVTIDGMTFYTSYVNLSKCIEHLSVLHLKETDILLLHHYFEDGFDGVDFEQLKGIGCKTIFLGHNHCPLPEFKREYEGISIYRTGSLLRNSADESNLKRDIFYTVYDNGWKIVKLDCVRKAEDVFTENAYKRENLKKKKFIRNINEVLDRYTNNASVQAKFSIKQVLTEIGTPDKCLSYIQNVYTSIGETFI